MIFRRQTEEQREEKRDEKRAAQEEKRADEEARWRAAQAAKKEEAFRTSPTGRARASFENGDQLFQITFHGVDPHEALNSIAAEGWQLHSFSTSQAISSAANPNLGLIDITSRLVCTYIFVRRPKP